MVNCLKIIIITIAAVYTTESWKTIDDAKYD